MNTAGGSSAADHGTRPVLSVVIPVHNAAETLGEQLEALVTSIDEHTEVVVVDNLSTDASRSIAEAFVAAHPQVRIVDAGERPGEAYARNVGLAAAQGSFIAFCDADDVVSAGWARAMQTALEESEYVTGPVELDRLNPPWLADLRGRAIYSALPRTVLGVPFAHGCNIGIRRAVIDRLGGFDDPGEREAGTPPRGTGAEDIDLAIRAWREGVTLHWVDQAVVHYRHRTGARARWRQAVAYGIAAGRVRRTLGEPWGVGVRVRHQGRRIRWLLATTPKLVSRGHRARWLWTLGLVVGEIRGGGH